MGYGPGIVQKLCARFLQLSKEPATVPPLRSPRFKRQKITNENSIAVVGGIRRRHNNISINSNNNNVQCDTFLKTLVSLINDFSYFLSVVAT